MIISQTKHVMTSLILLLSWWMTTPSMNASAETSSVSITISNIRAESGQLYVGLFREDEGFPVVGGNFYGQTIRVNANQHQVRFEIENGTYAVAVFQDLNANEELDENFFGIPTEPYCFSTNFRPTLSSPDFEDCSFNVNGQDLSMRLLLIQ